jgi:membrane fusion protein, multidrug efflux system
VYKRILLAYDGSTEGRTALREGALLARRYRARVFLLSVITETAGTKMGEGVGGGGVSQQHEDYERVLAEGMARLRQLGFDAVSKLVIGEPAGEIAAYAEQTGADLVIVGHRRQSAFGRWWSGPSGAYLVDRIRCSLLVCRNIISDEAFAAALAEADASAGGRHQGEPSAEHDGQASRLPTGVADVSAESRAREGGAAEPGGGRTYTPGAARPAGTERTPGAASRRRARVGLFLLLPLALIAGAYFYVTGGEEVSTDDAYVEANTVGVSTDVSGIVSHVYVSDNERVEQGQILYTLDDLQFRYALNRANAELGTVRNDLAALQANYRDMQAQIKQAQYDLDYNLTQFGRAQNLAKVNIVSRTGFDTAQRNLRNARQKFTSLQEQLAAIVANLNGDPSGPVERNPRYLAALAQRDEAARELAHTVVRAPFGGIVTSVPSVQPGKYLAASTTGFYLVDTDHVWIHADPKETKLTYVRPGQSATVTVDTYPGVRWRGVVASVSPAAAEQFALLPAQNTSGNWVKVVQRIPVRVRIDARDRSLPRLSAGMSVELSIDTGHPRGLPRFLTALFGHTE